MATMTALASAAAMWWACVVLLHHAMPVAAQSLSLVNTQGKALCSIAVNFAGNSFWDYVQPSWDLTTCAKRVTALPPPWCSWGGVGCTRNLVANLTLGGAGLQGTLPSAIGALNASLLQLDLGYNSLSGLLPNELGQLAPKLTFLSIASNALPAYLLNFPALAKLKNLKYLDMSYNGVSGPLPSFLGGLTALTYLNVYAANLQSTLPSWLAALTRLSTLDLSYNVLTGTVPATLAGAWKNSLTALYLMVWFHHCLTFPVPHGPWSVLTRPHPPIASPCHPCPPHSPFRTTVWAGAFPRRCCPSRPWRPWTWGTTRSTARCPRA